MAIHRDITRKDQVFIDTDRILRNKVWKGNPTQAQIDANQAVPEDVTGWTLSWVLSEVGGVALVSKATGSGISITGVYNVDPTLNTQRVDVLLEDTDTVALARGTYIYKLKRTDPGEETVLAFGTFELLEAAGD
jgi:hypothetical protein